jgi:hypothetical protein
MTRLLSILCLMAIGSGALPAQTPQPRDLSKIFMGASDAPWLPKTKGRTLPNLEVIEQRARKLAARQRNLDAFALPVFPREPAPKKTDKKPQLQREAERITLNEALQTLRISAINLRRGEFLINGHEVGRGDTLVLGYKGLTFEAVVSEVGPQEIRFKEQQSGETGVLPHRVLPRFVPQAVAPQATQGLLQGHATPIPPIR